MDPELTSRCPNCNEVTILMSNPCSCGYIKIIHCRICHVEVEVGDALCDHYGQYDLLYKKPDKCQFLTNKFKTVGEKLLKRCSVGVLLLIIFYFSTLWILASSISFGDPTSNSDFIKFKREQSPWLFHLLVITWSYTSKFVENGPRRLFTWVSVLYRIGSLGYKLVLFRPSFVKTMYLFVNLGMSKTVANYYAYPENPQPIDEMSRHLADLTGLLSLFGCVIGIWPFCWVLIPVSLWSMAFCQLARAAPKILDRYFIQTVSICVWIEYLSCGGLSVYAGENYDDSMFYDANDRSIFNWILNVSIV